MSVGGGGGLAPEPRMSVLFHRAFSIEFHEVHSDVNYDSDAPMSTSLASYEVCRQVLNNVIVTVNHCICEVWCVAVGG